jgi:hypothetical protein
MQTQINKFLVVLMAIVLLIAVGCTPPNNTSQNNGNGSNNQNTPAQKSTEERAALTVACKESEIGDEIMNNGRLPNIRTQFKSNRATLEFKNQELTFKGVISSPADEFIEFFKVIEGFRKADCVKKVIFKGGTAGGSPPNFEWSNTDTLRPCNVNIDEALENSDLTNQKENFKAWLNDTELILTGKINDGNGNKHIIKLFGTHLKSSLKRACISKIVFGSRGKTDIRTIEQDFSWMICDPLVECNGECKRECVKDENTNTNR